MFAYLFLGIGLVLIIEGLAWIAAPQALERMLELLRTLPEDVRRQIGFFAVVLGLIFLVIAVQFGA